MATKKCAGKQPCNDHRSVGTMLIKHELWQIENLVVLKVIT